MNTPQKYKIPIQPEILNPFSILQSLFGKEARHQETVEEIKDIIVSLKEDLQGVNLNYIDLSYANLTDAKMQNAILINADLHEAYMKGADLREVFLVLANISGAVLNNSNLRDAVCEDTDFSEAKMLKVDLSGGRFGGSNFNYADLSGANLENSSFTKKVDVTEEGILVRPPIIEATFKGTNISRVINPPENFIEQTKEKGADMKEDKGVAEYDFPELTEIDK